MRCQGGESRPNFKARILRVYGGFAGLLVLRIMGINGVFEGFDVLVISWVLPCQGLRSCWVLPCQAAGIKQFAHGVIYIVIMIIAYKYI